MCTQINTNASLAADFPGLFYHSSHFMQSAGIAYYKNVTQFLAAIGLTKAKFGANFSPGNFVGSTFQYIRLFREGAFTLPCASLLTPRCSPLLSSLLCCRGASSAFGRISVCPSFCSCGAVWLGERRACDLYWA